MRFLKTISVILDILILLPGVCSDEWRVNFTDPSPMCVLRGSSVDIGCSYDYQIGLTVADAFWFFYSGNTPFILSEQPSYQGRIEYIGNHVHDCALRIKDIEESDERDYYFRFLTTGDNNWTSKQPVSLSVTGLSVQATPPTVSEGTWVTLTCQTSCKPRATIVWFKNGQSTRWASKPKFQAKIEDAGSYQCAVEGQETWKSEAVMLAVQYGPQNAVLSVSPPGDVVKGSSVTLTCSSSGSNPPIQSYILLKDNTVVAQKNIMTISNIQPSDSGRYSCQAKNNINTVTSPQVTLHVYYPPEMPSVSVNPHGEVIEGIKVTLACHSDANPPVDNYTWYRDGGSRVISTAPQLVKDNISPADSGHYTCQGTNKHGSQMSSPHSINVLYVPVNVSVEVSAPGGPAEGSSVKLTCSSDGNPPVHNYTWYKRTEPSGSSPLVEVGSGQVLVLASLQSSHTGLYFCHTWNSLGENNSTEVLLHVDPIYINFAAGHLVILRVGIGVKVLLAVLLLPLVVWWAWKQDSNMKEEEDGPDYVNISGSVGRRRGFISSADQDTRVVEEESTNV